MIDFALFSLLMMFAFVAATIVFNVFKWGHDKEARGERTDIFGRPNNQMPKKRK
jgi:hypothetical protein